MKTPAQYATDILATFWDYSLPVNPVMIAEKMGLQVFYDPNLMLSAQFNLEENAIYVNENERKSRQRFSIAHEIGHAVLGHGTSPREDKTFNIYNYSPNELAANEFAAELLMPKDALNSLLFNSQRTFDQLCDTFDVSAEAMRVRLRRLGHSL